MKRVATAVSMATLFMALGLPSRAEAPAVKPAVVPFDLLKTRHMVVMIKVNGKGPYRVIFDTGAPVMLLNNKVAKESGVLGKDAQAPLFSLFGSAGEAKIRTLEIGALKAENVPTIVMDHPTLEAISKVLGPIEGIVGFPFFARYKMTIDYQAKQLTFVPSGYEPPDALKALLAAVMAMAEDRPPAPKLIAAAGQWGILLHKDKDDEEAGVTIKTVLAGSAAAAAGMKAGDRLLTIDGRWTDTIADAYRAAGGIKPGTEVNVAVQRAGRKIDMSVKPLPGL